MALKQIRVKEEYRNMILKDSTLCAEIAIAAHRDTQTVKRWCMTNNELLTMTSCVNTLKAYCKLKSISQLLEEVEIDKAA